MITLLDIKNSSSDALTPDSGTVRLFASNDTLSSVNDAGVVKVYDVSTNNGTVTSVTSSTPDLVVAT